MKGLTGICELKKREGMQMGSVYAYLRVSKDIKDIEKQRQGIDEYCEKHGIEIDKDGDGIIHIVMDRYKIKVDRQLTKLFELGYGDTLIFYSMGRLGYSLEQMFMIITKLINAGVKVVFISEDLVLDRTDLTEKRIKIWGELANAENERNRLNKRANLITRKRGKVIGRRHGQKVGSKLDKLTGVILSWYCDRGWSQAKIVRKLNKYTLSDGTSVGCTAVTLCKWLQRTDVARLVKLAKDRIEKQESERLHNI